MQSSTDKTLEQLISDPSSGFSDNLFWDIDTTDLNLDNQAAFIIGRVLNRGTWDDWLRTRDYYGLTKIKTIALTIRSLTPKALAFISIATDTRKESFRCFTLTQSSTTHWHY